MLIDPPGTIKGINSGLGYIAGSLLKEGHRVKTLDFNNYPHEQDKRLKEELAKGYPIVGLSVKANTVISSLSITNKIKADYKDTIIIAGGTEVTLKGENFLREYPIFDFAIIGEAEESILKFVKFIEGAEKPEAVDGLSYRLNGIRTNRFIWNYNLDALPFPDYSVFDKPVLRDYAYPLVTSRGCPYKCIFCAVGAISGSNWRARSVENVLKELLYIKQKYNISNFEIVDDNFTFDINRAKDFSRCLKNSGQIFKWSCANGIRADKTDKELFELMKSAGCETVWFGIETLNSEVYPKINKAEGLDTILNAIAQAKATNLDVCGYFIIGLPGSNYKKDYFSLQQSRKLKLKASIWSLTTVIPKTSLYEWVIFNGEMLNKYDRVSFFFNPAPTFETKDYSAKERMRIFYKASLYYKNYDCLLSPVGTNLMRLWKIVIITCKYSDFDIYILANLFKYIYEQIKSYAKRLIIRLIP